MFAAGGLARATLNAPEGSKDGVGGGAVFFVFLFTAIFGATWLTVPWLYPAEIFPLEVRARGNAWGVVGWSIGNGWCVSIMKTIPNLQLQLICARSCCSLRFSLLSTRRRFICLVV